MFCRQDKKRQVNQFNKDSRYSDNSQSPGKIE
jgi:hypothetical protein